MQKLNQLETIRNSTSSLKIKKPTLEKEDNWKTSLPKFHKLQTEASQFSVLDKDEDIKPGKNVKIPTPRFQRRTNTGNMYEDLIKDLNNSNEDLNKLTFDFISEDEDEDKLGEESKNFLKKFSMTLHEESAFLNRNKNKAIPISIVHVDSDSDNSDELDTDKEKYLELEK